MKGERALRGRQEGSWVIGDIVKPGFAPALLDT